jgi:hypothetical protein
VTATPLDPPADPGPATTCDANDCVESDVNGTCDCALSDVVGAASSNEVFSSCTTGGT